ncbi:D-alanyl-D-alanine carboxypeptidase/D-alanyl-D-alanine-endopeptidase (penicillin-binding protein 4) [Catalinimonas alkaloidigena]|uniref:D-alanyl-D-alanine carboxypeptidase n=1 Tax=Catalinimonas alkaloidigena TaxID=1075417 RepID=UPI0024060417|nr:D-alanyl-D-alanine carboxypeptidase [Catalinimonas alkaloidigena]MDF9795190.1 D-alanyl-D-alanine carboxypeptidase/D-alanyl-D-alanine-endopeptidase (penicillin-binding protein 4) [Catalinimonas alkaloidigena]
MKKQVLHFLFFAAIIIFISACASRPGISSRKFKDYIAESPVFKTNFTGFALYDTRLDEMVYTYQGDKYYTPASNTKIFSLYASLKLMGDSIPALEYTVQGDSLLFTGTGDPTFLHHDITDLDTTYSQHVYNFLKDYDGQLVYVPRPTEDRYFGPGWAWSDYNFYYSPEKSVFPMYANVVRFNFKEGFNKPLVSPDFFTSYVEGFPDPKAPYSVFRQQHENYFSYAPKDDTLSFERDVPFIQSDRLVARLLSDTLKRNVQLMQPKLSVQDSFPVFTYKLYSLPADSVYKRMMQHSDNFFAEQLLMTCSSVFQDTLSTEWTIDYMKEHYLNDLPDEPIWRDGSGLSRYNLQTPRSIVALLRKVGEELNDERIKDIFPAGGESGTISSWYPNPEGSEPFVFAKTGTLSNKSALSGFIYTKSGKKLIFSFLHNNYITSTTPLKKEMERILQDIYLNY